MKLKHHKSLKFHTAYSIFLAVVFIVIIALVHEVSLGVSMGFLAFYVIGNGIIHAKKNELNQDSVVEYVLVSAIVLVLIVGII